MTSLKCGYCHEIITGNLVEHYSKNHAKQFVKYLEANQKAREKKNANTN